MRNLIVITFVFCQLLKGAPAPILSDQAYRYCLFFLGGPPRDTMYQILSVERFEKAYSKMMDRISKADQTNDNVIAAKFQELLVKFLAVKAELERSTLTEGRFVAENFLLGVIVWAEKLQELDLAISILDRKAADGSNLDLDYFASQMAWVTDGYDGRGRSMDRVSARASLGDFDAIAYEYYKVSVNKETGVVTIPELQSWQPGLRDNGIRFSLDPIPGLGLVLNNGRQIGRHDIQKPDYFALRFLQRTLPNEHLLAPSDRFVRKFQRILDVRNGHIIPLPYGADYLMVREDPPNSGHFIAILRELKCISPRQVEVPVETAQEQIQNSWERLETALQDRIVAGKLSFGEFELVVPTRAPSVRGQLGNGYRVGRRLSPTSGGDFREILTPSGNRAEVQWGGRTFPLNLREFDITAAEYNDLWR